VRFKPALSMAAMVLALPAVTSAGEPASPAHTIILFGADWCAPCVVELRELPALARAAAPDRVVLAWTDRAARLPAEAVGLGVTQVPVASAREMLARYGERNAGLPLAVMVRGDGAACGRLRKGLSKDGIAALRKSCGEG
jgi:thiol-disulfide isomerase/thioredoxin